MPEEENKKYNWFLSVMGLGCIIVICLSIYNFYFVKDFDFFVETNCDPSTQTCFYRDCSIKGECPPNNLSYYSKYTIKAKDFNMCSEGDCTNFCINNNNICQQEFCTEQDIESGSCVQVESLIEN